LLPRGTNNNSKLAWNALSGNGNCRRVWVDKGPDSRRAPGDHL
jgi:hypothetical protein